MTTYVSKSDFLAALSVAEFDAEVSGLGTVRIRPLTLMERAAMTRDFGDDTPGMQAAALVAGMVEPKLTLEDVAAIREGKAGLVDHLTILITDASGMGDEFQKKAGPGS